MQLDMMTVLSSLAGIFLLIAVGYVLARRGTLPETARKPLTDLLVDIALPGMVFSTFATREYDSSFLQLMLEIIALGFAGYLLSILAAWALARLLRIPDGCRGIWAFSTAFCNNGFMGFPVILSILGQEGLAYAVIFSIPYNILTFSIGIGMIRGDNAEARSGQNIFRMMLTRVNVIMALSLIIGFLKIPVPGALTIAATQLGNLTTPVSMLLTGMTLAGTGIREMFSDPRVISCTFARLLLIPALTIALLARLPEINAVVSMMAAITLAMPAAGMGVAYAEKYGSDAEFAARAICLSSLLCVATIPAMVLLAEAWL